MARKLRLPIAATSVLVLALAACGPVKVDIAGINVDVSPKPGHTPSPGTSATPTAGPSGASATPRGGSTATPSPEGSGTTTPEMTPTPGDTGTATPSPQGSDGSAASPTPTPAGTQAPPASPLPIASRGPMGPGPNAVTKSYPLTDGSYKPTAVGADSQGNAWVGMGTFSGSSTTNASHLIKLGRDGSQLTSVPMDGGVVNVTVDRYDNAWALCTVSSAYELAKVSPDGKVVSRLKLANGWNAYGLHLFLDNFTSGTLWVTDGTSDKVNKVSPNGGLLGTYPTGGTQAYGVTVDNAGNAWVGASSADTNFIKLGPTGAVSASYKLGDIGAVNTVGADYGGHVWAAGPSTISHTSGTQIVVADGDGKPTSSFPVGFYVMAMQPDPDGHMWVLANSSASASAIKLGAKGETVDSYALGDGVTSFAFAGDGAIWAASNMAGVVTRVGMGP